MPLYKVALRFAHDSTWPARRKWSTSLFVEASSSTAAAAAGATGYTGYLRGATRDSVFCYEVYATDLAPTTDDYTVLAVPSGLRRGVLLSAGRGEPYLPKACVRVVLGVAGSRPSFKFWRCGLYEGDIAGGVDLDAGLATNITEAWQDFLVEGSGIWRDPDGQILQGVTKLSLTTREFGRTAGNEVPVPPAVG